MSINSNHSSSDNPNWPSWLRAQPHLYEQAKELCIDQLARQKILPKDSTKDQSKEFTACIRLQLDFFRAMIEAP